MKTTKFFTETKTGRSERDGNVNYENFDIEIFDTKEEAEKAFSEADISMGDVITLHSVIAEEEELDGDFNPFDFETEELDYKEDKGQSLKGCILVGMSWETYVGYARKFQGLHKGDYFGADYESELIDGNDEKRFSTFYEVLVTKKQKDECKNDSELIDFIYQQLCDYNKWTTRTDSPLGKYEIASELGLEYEEKEEK